MLAFTAAPFAKAGGPTLTANWPALRRVAAKAEPALQVKFLQAVERLKSVYSISEIITAIDAGTVASLDIDPWSTDEETGELASVLLQVLGAGGQEAADQLGTKIHTKLSFDAYNEKAYWWAQEEGGKLITRITDEARTNIQDVVFRAMRGAGLNDVARHPREQAELIREYVGLTPQHAKAVQTRFQASLKSGMARTVALDVARRYASKLLDLRSYTIARHETLMAAHVGQEQMWSQAVDHGFLGLETMRVWIVTPDDRLCSLCAPMAGKLAPIEGTWDTPKGRISTPQQIHVQCRCAEGLKIDLPGGGKVGITPAIQTSSTLLPFVEAPSTSGVLLRPPSSIVVPQVSQLTTWPIKQGQTRTEKEWMIQGKMSALSTQQEPWRRALSSKERGAFENYTGASYRGINKHLTGRPLTFDDGDVDTIKAEANRMVDAMKRAAPMREPVVVWRGLTRNASATLDRIEKDGAIGAITLQGLQSTTLDPSFAAKWSRHSGGDGAVLEIVTRRGTSLGSISSHGSEYEVLLPHNAQYKFHGVERHVQFEGSAGTYIIKRVYRLELIED